MNIAARTPTKFMHGAATWSAHSHPGWFRVDLNGDFRIISRDGSGFIAWLGSQDRHWAFSRALDACVEDMEHQAFLLAHPAAPAPVMGAEEVALLEFSDADNASDRLARARMEQVS